MTTEYNITDKIINVNKEDLIDKTQMTDINCFSSTSCEPQHNIKDIDNITKMETECNIPEDLSDTSSQRINDINKSEEKEQAFANDGHFSKNNNIEENLKLDNPLNETINEEHDSNSTKQTLNEKETSLKNSSSNEQDMSVDDYYDNITLGYSREVVNEAFNDEDMLTIACDESLENSPNEMFENVTDSVIDGLNNKDKSVQDWSIVQDVDLREEGEISDNGIEYDLNDENEPAKNWNTMQDEIPLNKKIKPMQFVFGLLCMSFKEGPYEFTLANMSHYISGQCDRNKYWLKNLDSYIKKLNITHLYVIGNNQASLIDKYVYSVKIRVLFKHLLPERENRCPNCFRYGCSKYKVSCILHHNFRYDFKIPCTFKNTFKDSYSQNKKSSLHMKKTTTF